MLSSGVLFQSHERYSFSSLSLSAIRLLRRLETLYNPRVARSMTGNSAARHLDLNMLLPGFSRAVQRMVKTCLDVQETMEMFISWTLLPRTRILDPLYRREGLAEAGGARPARLSSLFTAPSQAILVKPHLRQYWPYASTTIICSISLH